MKEFKFKDINRGLLKELEVCKDAAALKKYLADKDYDISAEYAGKLYDYINGLHEMSDKETSETSGGCSGSTTCDCAR